ncbi:HypC/HybG/HupF family hydrogenase formation chaperone [Neptuniibacter sp. QD72_48]|uniref:HypC/HybG/HupF family hydrogenase formation chaperone n=1 Tax=unclassified Neptuniibacter TaxID=2630693 RepID=UPI0039F6C084
MRIVCCDGLSAECENGDQIERVDLSLLGEQPTGTWVLVFLGAAREVLSEQRAAEVRNALIAVQSIMQGDAADVDRLFSDLIEQPPQLPPHLQNNN